MSLSASDLMELAALNLSSEQMAGVLRLLAKSEASEEDRRAKQRERTKRHRGQKRDCNVTVDVTVTEVSPLSSPLPLSPKPPITNPPIIPPSTVGGEGEGREAVLTDRLGWPVEGKTWADCLIAETACADPARDIWPRSTMPVLLGWHETDKFEWRDVVAGIRAVMVKARATDPPKSWRYFAPAIARAKTDRTTITPEALPHERRNNFQTAAERNQDSTIAAFRNVFGGSSAGEDEPVYAA